MYLFFDTETTGLPNYSLDLTDAAQPHIIQIACLLTDDKGREVMSWKSPIVPDGFKVDERLKCDDGRPTAFSFNGLGNGLLNQYGIQLRQALAMFRLFETKAVLKVAHNYRFDGFLLKCAHARAGAEPVSPAIDKFCTMKVFQDLKGKLPGLSSAALQAAYTFCTGREIDNAHDALADVRACKDVFFWIRENGYYKDQPRVVPLAAA